MAHLSSISADRKKRGLCLLSLDGGGIRGLSELIIIEELMERIKWNERLEKTPLPAEYFDLIGGTSTGGLIAILLGRLRLSAAEAIKVYESLACEIFSEKKAKGKEGTFKSSNLEAAIKSVIISHLGQSHSDALMYDKGFANGCRAFVCAVGASDVTHASGPTLFRTYAVAKNASYNCAIWEAARATSAAPTIFKRIKIGSPASGIEYVDAALGCNNPTKEVIAECERIFGENAHVACVVSIGTGRAGSAGFSNQGIFEKWIPLGLIEVLGKFATDSGKVAEEMKRKYSNVPGIYYRFDVDRGLQNISLDEWKRLGDVREHTRNYMKLQEIDQQVDEVVRKLSESSNHTYDARALAGFAQPMSYNFLQLNVPRKRVSHFTVRQALLADIIHRLLDRSSSRTVVLLGMGGSGKTQLALELCQQAEENFGFMAAVWIDASSPDSVIQSYKLIAQKITNGGFYGDIESENAISFVQDVIQKWKYRWLMVFDNYDTPNAFRDKDIRSYIPSGMNRHVLFTSRHADSERLGQCIRVATMSEDESVNLLLQRSPNEKENEEGRRIAWTLGYLALALDQAGAYIRARNLPLKDFISHYEKRKEMILREVPEQWEYRKNTTDAERETLLSVFTTWELSFEQVKGDETEKRNKDHFLTLASFFDNNKISENIFHALYNERSPEWMSIFNTDGQWETERYGDVLAEFQRLSLLQVSAKQEKEFQFSLHPVVRDWVRLRKNHDMQQQFAMEAIIGLARYLSDFDDSFHLDLELKRDISAHIDACVHHEKALVEVLSKLEPEYHPDPEKQFARFYVGEGRYNEAKVLLKRALTRYEEQLGAQSLHTLAIKYKLSMTYHFCHQNDKAAEMCESVLIEYERQLGPQHAKTLYTMNYLALIYRQLERYDEAQNLCERALISCQKVLGPYHNETLRAMIIQAKLHGSQGRYDEAEKAYKRAIAGRELQVDSQDANTLNLTILSAEIHEGQGRYDEALRLYKRAVVGLEVRRGPQHPDTLRNKERLVRLEGKSRSEDHRRGKEEEEKIEEMRSSQKKK